MDEKPKSIWKKSLKFPGLLMAWLVLVVVTMLVFSIVILLMGDIFSKTSDFVGLLIFGAVVATILLCLWLFIRWIFCWRNFKRFLFGLACFATLIALFYAEEDWRGLHDWNKFKREWEAKGERFDWQSIVPPPVPDDQNFAFSPVWIAEVKHNFLTQPQRAESWYGDRINGEEVSNLVSLMPVSVSGLVGTNNWWTYHLPNMPEMPGDWTTSQFMDLKPWQSYYRDLEITNPTAGISVAPQPQSPAADVLLALGKFDPVIEQLRQDSARPDSRFPIQYDTGPAFAILLPHLAAEKRYAQVLQLRAIAELQNGASEKALADVKLMMRLTDASRTEPFLISHLVRIAILQITLQPIYEGLAERKWSDSQLADLDSELAKLDFLADYKTGIRGCPAFDIAAIEFFRHLHDYPQDLDLKRPHFYFLVPFFSLVQMLSNLSSDEDHKMKGFQILALSFGPSGWLDQNELNLCRLYMELYLPIVDQDAEIISPARVRAAEDALGQAVKHQTPENVFETLFVPGLGSASIRIARAQTSANLARVAIALERYRLVHGEFPESLDALAPQFTGKIPHDVINGQPLKYRREADGQFTLYSVGWNEADDGGVVIFKKGSTPEVDTDKGDWVWRYPQK
jgi:hypothetical protein